MQENLRLPILQLTSSVGSVYLRELSYQSRLGSERHLHLWGKEEEWKEEEER